MIYVLVLILVSGSVNTDLRFKDMDQCKTVGQAMVEKGRTPVGNKIDFLCVKQG